MAGAGCSVPVKMPGESLRWQHKKSNTKPALKKFIIFFSYIQVNSAYVTITKSALIVMTNSVEFLNPKWSNSKPATEGPTNAAITN